MASWQSGKLASYWSEAITLKLAIKLSEIMKSLKLLFYDSLNLHKRNIRSANLLNSAFHLKN